MTEYHEIKKLYRVDTVKYTDGLRLQVFCYDVVKHTPCGFQIAYWPKKWVSSTSKKRFAYPTKEEAMESFIARKHRQIVILGARLRYAQQALEMATRCIDFIPNSELHLI